MSESEKATPALDWLPTPKKFADRVLEGRKSKSANTDPSKPEWTALLSPGGVKRLIDLAYHASQMPDEGRYSRIKLVAKYVTNPSFLVSRFSPIEIRSPNVIRKMAPACTGEDRAFLVVERDAKLYLEGVVNLGWMGYYPIPGSPPAAARFRGPEFRIEVLGPGHLRTRETHCPSLEFRGGDIRTITPFDEPVGAVRIRESVLKKVSGVLIARLNEKAGSWAQRKSFQLVLSRLLRKTVDVRHGGTFVFLPTSCSDVSIFNLNLQFGVSDLDLGRDLVEWHLACARASKESWSPQETPKAVHAAVNAEQCRVKLMMDTDAVSDLGSVDGCVVLDQELKVFGFGAKIEAQMPADGSSHRPFFRNGELRSTSDFMESIGATRHQSAARLCHAHHGVVVYTVSQDGDVNLFFADKNGVHIHGPLDVPATDMDATMTS